MTDLIATLEGLTQPSREVDLEIAIATGEVPDEVAKYGPHLRRIEMRRVDPYTASLDAAIALVEIVLPGHGYTIDHQPVYGPHHDASIFNEMVVTIGSGRGPTSAIALLIALLRAKEAKDDA